MRTPVVSSPLVPLPAGKHSRIKLPVQEHPKIAWQLFDDYNHHRSRCAAIRQQRERIPLKDYKANDERLALFGRVARWCEDQQMDPRLWLYVLFRARRWFWPPKMEASALMSPRYIEAYRMAEGLDAYRRHVVPSSVVRGFDPNVDLSFANEAYKARLLDSGQEHRCLEALVEETFGFHPKSLACTRCPLADECKRRLQEWCAFDVIGLREGRVPREHAIAQAIEAHQKAAK